MAFNYDIQCNFVDAVILLQESKRRYHFSSELLPYVHYVPIGVGDIIDKIEWLKRNPILSERIAKNAQIFAQSFLRLEDHLCHSLNILEVVGDIMNGTSAAFPSVNALKIDF